MAPSDIVSVVVLRLAFLFSFSYCCSVKLARFQGTLVTYARRHEMLMSLYEIKLLKISQVLFDLVKRVVYLQARFSSFFFLFSSGINSRNGSACFVDKILSCTSASHVPTRLVHLHYHGKAVNGKKHFRLFSAAGWTLPNRRLSEGAKWKKIKDI